MFSRLRFSGLVLFGAVCVDVRGDSRHGRDRGSEVEDTAAGDLLVVFSDEV